MKNTLTLHCLAFCLFLISAISLQSQVPDWFEEEMKTLVGVWKTDNSTYLSENEPFQHYETEWKWGIGKRSITGALYGVLDGKRAGKFWEFRQYWDFEQNKGMLLQFGGDGTHGSGEVKPDGKNRTESDQTFYVPNGTTYQVVHRASTEGNKHITKSFNIGPDRQWIERREYTWWKQVDKRPQGTIDHLVCRSEALKGNLLGTSALRSMMVYTPPGYNEDLRKRYPVLYLLHGYGGTEKAWLSSPHTQGFHIQEAMDSLIETGAIEDMILVMPDASNRLGGSWYTNSEASGQWETFITEELIRFVDEKYRTIPVPDARGIAGHSMGAYGALKLAMNNPDKFRTVYAMSGVNLVDDKLAKMKYSGMVEQLEGNRSSNNLDLFGKLLLSKSIAFIPDPKAPFHCRYLYRRNQGEWQLDEEVWEDWSTHLLAPRIATNKEQLMHLRIRLDHGSQDPLVSESREFAKMLNEHQLNYDYDEYRGDHTNRFRERMVEHVLPFFSRYLN